MAKVLFKRKTTQEIEDLPIEDGALIYNTDNGKTYMDFNEERIQTGGNADTMIAIGGEEPTDEDIKIWFPDETIKTKASEVINSMEGNETDLAPSVNIVKDYIKNENSLIYCKKQTNLSLSLNYQNIEDWEEIYNLGDAFELAEGIVKVKKANHVIVKSKLRISATGTPMFYSYILKNGSNVKTSWVIQGARADCTLINEAIIEVVEGDTLTCSIYGDSGTSLKEDATTFIVEKID